MSRKNTRSGRTDAAARGTASAATNGDNNRTNADTSYDAAATAGKADAMADDQQTSTGATSRGGGDVFEDTMDADESTLESMSDDEGGGFGAATPSGALSSDFGATNGTLDEDTGAAGATSVTRGATTTGFDDVLATSDADDISMDEVSQATSLTGDIGDVTDDAALDLGGTATGSTNSTDTITNTIADADVAVGTSSGAVGTADTVGTVSVPAATPSPAAAPAPSVLSRIGQAASPALNLVRANPIPAALAALGLTALVLNARRRRSGGSKTSMAAPPPTTTIIGKGTGISGVTWEGGRQNVADLNADVNVVSATTPAAGAAGRNMATSTATSSASVAGSVADAASAARDAVTGAATSAAGAVSDVAQSAAQTVAGAASGAAETARSAASGAAQGTSRAVSGARAQLGRVGSALVGLVRRNPVPAAASALSLLWLYQDNRTGGATVRKAKEIASRVEDLADRGEDRLDNIGDRIEDRVEGTVDALKNRTKNAVGSLAGNASEASDALSAGASSAATAASATSGALRQSPLVFVIVAVTVGTTIGAVLPVSAWESRLFGDARDRLADKAQQAAQGLADRVQNVATTVIDTATTPTRQ